MTYKSTTTPAPFALRLLSPLPALTGITELGTDRLCIRLGHPEPISLVRVLGAARFDLVLEAVLAATALPLANQRIQEIVAQLQAAELRERDRCRQRPAGHSRARALLHLVP